MSKLNVNLWSYSFIFKNKWVIFGFPPQQLVLWDISAQVPHLQSSGKKVSANKFVSTLNPGFDVKSVSHKLVPSLLLLVLLVNYLLVK